MKRVGFSRFKHLDVTRKVQQCLRFESVHANGDGSNDSDKCVEQTECKCQRVITHEDVSNETFREDHTNKSNILNTIRKKWRKSKRNKRCDARGRSETLTNVCQCDNGSCELRQCCTKHYKASKQKSSDKNMVWPLSCSILRCQSHQERDDKSDDSTNLITNSNEENEVCSCFRSLIEEDCSDIHSATNLACSTLHSCTSHSLSNISHVNNTVSSLVLKTESVDNLCRVSQLGANNIDKNCVCENSDLLEKDFDANQLETQIVNYEIIPRVGNLTQELYKLSKYGWYWGPINRGEAESKLVDQPDGAFLVRDSSDDRYILSLSFRSYGKTLHTRIEHSHGMFSFYAQPEPEGHPSIVELIKQSMCYSQSGVFCYSRSRSPGSPSYPVRLTKPISRFTQIRSLQYLCRFVIRQYTRFDHIQKLPLPHRIKGYLEEGHY